MVLVNYGDKETVHGHHHTIHLHGHDFVVIKTGFPIADPKTGELIEKNKYLYCADKCGSFSEFSHEDYQNLVSGSHEKSRLPRFFDGFFNYRSYRVLQVHP